MMSCGLWAVISVMIFSSIHCVMRVWNRASSRHNALLIMPAAAMPSASRCEKMWMNPSFSEVSWMVLAAWAAEARKASVAVFSVVMVFTFVVGDSMSVFAWVSNMFCVGFWVFSGEFDFLFMVSTVLFAFAK